ncbi:putative inner membrane protein [bacterium BMS3Abin07]|nr:putative inner membrane protein [bacterium BMS3Abin07]GBE31213.1 putative inner membrane protein [bacterium BMS3Bbin05]
MSQKKFNLREGLVFALIMSGFFFVLYLILKIKSYAALNVDTLSDEDIAVIKHSIRYVVVISGLVIGGIMGAVVQRSKFCIATACHSVVISKDYTQTRAYAMALFVAILGTQILYKTGQVDISRSIYVSFPFTWLSYIIGGFTFGVGIVYAGGCASRILVRAGEGNLGGLVSVMAFIFASGATLWGITAKLRVDYLNKLTIDLHDQYLPNIAHGIPFWAILIVIEIILLLFMLKSPKDSAWRGWRWPMAGVVIGLTIISAWWINGEAFRTIPLIDTFSFTGPNDPTLLQTWRPKSLTFALADAQTYRYIMLWTGESINFAIATVLGVLGGSFISAVITGTFRLIAPPLPQFKSNLFGGTLMGFGAVVGLGCNIGQGLSGISTLSIGSILTMTFIFIGAVAGAKFMEWYIARNI